MFDIHNNAAMVQLSRFRHARRVARSLVGLGLIGFGIRLAFNRR
jgi:threonine/homoserine/homoserine lactone efflux protein